MESKKLRIFYVCDVYLSRQIAWTTHVKEITENMKMLGHEVILFAPAYGKYREETSVDVVYVPTTNIRFFRVFVFYLLVFLYIFLYHLKRGRPDVVYIREMYISATAQLAAKLLSVPAVLEVNGINQEERSDTSGSSPEVILSGFFQNWGVKMADMVIAITPKLRGKLAERANVHIEKIFVVRNGTNVDMFTPMDEMEAKERLVLKRDRDYVCFVSSLYPFHGALNLVESSPDVLKERGNVSFLIVGDGFMKGELIERTRELGVYRDFVFTGEVGYDYVPLYINASKLALCFIRNIRESGEGSPLKLFEYMSCGKAILASKGPECGQFVEQAEAGRSVDTEDKKEISRSILALLEDDQERERMGKKGRDYALQNCSWKKVTERVLELSSQNDEIPKGTRTA